MFWNKFSVLFLIVEEYHEYKQVIRNNRGQKESPDVSTAESTVKEPLSIDELVDSALVQCEQLPLLQSL